MRNLRSSCSQQGFSFIELVIASFILLMLLLGIMPVFHRATVTNKMAYDNTLAASFARTEMEGYFQAPFYDTGPDPKMTIPTGSNELVIQEWYDPVDEEWVVGEPPEGTQFEWSRTITVRQFNISAIDNGVLDETQALAGNAHPGNVHLKQVLIEVQRGSQQSFLGGPPRTLTLNAIRSN